MAVARRSPPTERVIAVLDHFVAARGRRRRHRGAPRRGAGQGAAGVAQRFAVNFRLGMSSRDTVNSYVRS